jgi:hypothetical protein
MLFSSFIIKELIYSELDKKAFFNKTHSYKIRVQQQV